MNCQILICVLSGYVSEGAHSPSCLAWVVNRAVTGECCRGCHHLKHSNQTPVICSSGIRRLAKTSSTSARAIPCRSKYWPPEGATESYQCGNQRNFQDGSTTVSNPSYLWPLSLWCRGLSDTHCRKFSSTPGFQSLCQQHPFCQNNNVSRYSHHVTPSC